MKRLLLIALAMVGYCHIVNAQITYQPFIPNQSQRSQPQSYTPSQPQTNQYQPSRSRSNQSQPESQTIRTTAYYTDIYSGDTYKVPIKVQQRQNAWGNMGYYVVEYYIDGGVGGKWQKINPAEISQCNSAFTSNPLEEYYMYKAFFNTQTHYFDF